MVAPGKKGLQVAHETGHFIMGGRDKNGIRQGGSRRKTAVLILLAELAGLKVFNLHLNGKGIINP